MTENQKKTRTWIKGLFWVWQKCMLWHW